MPDQESHEEMPNIESDQELYKEMPNIEGVHSKINRDNIQGISKLSIRKLALRAAVKRSSAPIYEETRNILKTFLGGVIRDSASYAEVTNRKTIRSLNFGRGKSFMDLGYNSYYRYYSLAKFGL
ncbi:20161_t:CDS:2 [Entrophospora sp. SA101]|nr:20161_t:CDS:2 [Entrophospora sp. SA101]